LLKSMTGYGRGEAIGAGRKFIIELKSVNHRFCEIVVRLPKNMLQIEDRIRKQVQSCISRGRIDCYFTVEETGPKNVLVKVDKCLVTAYYKAMKEMLNELEAPQEIKLEHLLALPGVFTVEDSIGDLEDFWPIVEQALNQSLFALQEMRKIEGTRLKADLQLHIERIEQLNKEIESRAPLVVEEYRERLTQRMQELIPGGVLEPLRLAGEAALFAERSNIAEEIVRIYSHLNQLRLSAEEEEPVGRKLDFLVQELNREINTIASKASDLKISQLVMEVKSELEKIREQIQNVE